MARPTEAMRLRRMLTLMDILDNMRDGNPPTFSEFCSRVRMVRCRALYEEALARTGAVEPSVPEAPIELDYHPANLTRSEKAMFDVLLSKQGEVASSTELAAAVHAVPFDPKGLVRQNISNMRQKGCEIRTVRARGYRLVGTFATEGGE